MPKHFSDFTKTLKFSVRFVGNLMTYQSALWPGLLVYWPSWLKSMGVNWAGHPANLYASLIGFDPRRLKGKVYREQRTLVYAESSSVHYSVLSGCNYVIGLSTSFFTHDIFLISLPDFSLTAVARCWGESLKALQRRLLYTEQDFCRLNGMALAWRPRPTVSQQWR